ncbi:MAG: ribbon-helix-helix protein, CopG family [Peptococcaceae bacterium]|nr:ribbon-helix-helix protein, CopG family [Peptococcaceae bacterium]
MTLETKMAIRVPEEWHRQVKAEAALRGTTVSKLIRTAVDEWLKQNPREAAKDGKER